MRGSYTTNRNIVWHTIRCIQGTLCMIQQPLSGRNTLGACLGSRRHPRSLEKKRRFASTSLSPRRFPSSPSRAPPPEEPPPSTTPFSVSTHITRRRAKSSNNRAIQRVTLSYKVPGCRSMRPTNSEGIWPIAALACGAPPLPPPPLTTSDHHLSPAHCEPGPSRIQFQSNPRVSDIRPWVAMAGPSQPPKPLLLPWGSPPRATMREILLGRVTFMQKRGPRVIDGRSWAETLRPSMLF